MCDIKKCTRCEEGKELKDFDKHKLGAKGVDSVCKICKKELKQQLTEKYRNINSQRNFELEKEFLLICTKCKLEKKCSEFYKDLSSKRGYSNYCITCKYEHLCENKRPIPEYKKCNICEEIKIKNEFYAQKRSLDGLYSSCKSCCSEKEKSDYNENKDKILERNKKSRLKHKEKYKEGSRKYYINNKEKVLTYSKRRYEENKETIKEKVRIYTKTDKFKENRKNLRKSPLYLLQINLQNLILHEFTKQNLHKNKRTKEILGCTIEEFKNHIEKQFLPWMSWDNYGNCISNEYNCTWNLDHIIPISWAQTENEIQALNHWSNFQPLCSKINKHEKKDNILPICNIELNMTVYSK